MRKKNAIVKIISLILSGAVCVSLLCACGSSEFDAENEITVVSRESGSGTRGAFISLMGLEETGADGTYTDMTTKEAIIANKTDIMLTSIAGDKYGIGYVSFGSLSDSVKALRVDGTEPTAENVRNGSYSVTRPFNIVTQKESSVLVRDFINFILSSAGQAIVADGYIRVDDDPTFFAGTCPSGKIVIAGSSSVSPIMEKLIESYMTSNPNAEIELQTSDSTAGITGVADGTCDIGMVSRELTESEKKTVSKTTIALDGIAVIVNRENPIFDITSENVQNIFSGVKTRWSEVA
jgi:phosphate transport system substrate-binding protein